MQIVIAIAFVLLVALAAIWLIWDDRRRDRQKEVEENMAKYGLYEGSKAPEELRDPRLRLGKGRLPFRAPSDAGSNQALRRARQEKERRWTE